MVSKFSKMGATWFLGYYYAFEHLILGRRYLGLPLDVSEPTLPINVEDVPYVWELTRSEGD